MPESRRQADIERVLHWVFAEQRCYIPVSVDPELAFDRGLTAKPRRRPRGNWTTASAAAGMKSGARSMRIFSTPHPDAKQAADAVRQLAPRTASLIVAHATHKTRPNWMEGAYPIFVPVWRDKATRTPRIKGRDPNGHYGYCAIEWAVTQTHIDQAREDYDRWHGAVTRLSASLRLALWDINGFSAPTRPWLQPVFPAMTPMIEPEAAVEHAESSLAAVLAAEIARKAIQFFPLAFERARGLVD